MMQLPLSEVARITGGRLHEADGTVRGVFSDSRQPLPGGLFVALRGPRFDGHAFAGADLPAAGLLVERPVASPLPWVEVADTRRALADLAAAWRRRCGAAVVALTGSNGKTTVKEMLAAILHTMGPVWATRGNLNNELGVPLTLLGLSPGDRFAVIEMGANHAGEIAGLTALAAPDVALITNAGPAHLEGFGSIEAVARAKGEIFSGLAADGVAVINGDDPHADYWAGRNTHRRVLRFGLRPDVDVAGELDAQGRLRITAAGETVTVALPLAGEHNRSNALAAAAAALALGVDLQGVRSGLEAMPPVPGRLALRPGSGGVRLIDDSYNANPASVRAAIQVLAKEPGRRFLVLGDMGELGTAAPELHAAVGRHAAEHGIDGFWATGPLCRHAVEAFGPGGRHFPDRQALIKALRGTLRSGDVVLVKGSRSQRMDAVADALAVCAGADHDKHPGGG
ncbi:UDP-N-acetylmuramoyl-tripeptide--D-alanyl-D-alanine ligase [Ectothiorhodospira mobilis]|uniref:UDP-N-acetylmuramoyl-tripeptide--D-alanyl-D- alanine ligase n=1 Tax=Ectothiorhodospira mobilis TaxID=195064 RepID=UPI001EE9A550|nr:UDP-N-acetylmuramoyl-tripeptide--D-alanyl-D-alanine ligase [Ectothiorhodospira mobilis]MCG5534528.1 UDP-N-acetylmuramoyl-tripeptide--D-alanyl-D-alanine ligase [Ectothiorhodospira mobilis]